jgi:hypothetical protein
MADLLYVLTTCQHEIAETQKGFCCRLFYPFPLENMINLNCTVRSESRCALRLRYVNLVVKICSVRGGAQK